MNWNNFYAKRVNSSYQEYFEDRYYCFLQEVLRLSYGGEAIDAGCGIGSVSKYLSRYQVATVGFDLCLDMVKLAQLNVPTRPFFQNDLLTFKSDRLVVTHGVLEHFEDDIIHTILENNPNSIHYVPLEGYGEPSFGDERLLPKEYWLDTFKASAHETFNNGLDLYFVA
ncbi:MAG: methyltransferase domain-containing protein [Elainellaceae cyanobacterium]